MVSPQNRPRPASSRGQPTRGMYALPAMVRDGTRPRQTNRMLLVPACGHAACSGAENRCRCVHRNLRRNRGGRPLRFTQPHPPFPACFQVTHRKILLSSVIFQCEEASCRWLLFLAAIRFHFIEPCLDGLVIGVWLHDWDIEDTTVIGIWLQVIGDIHRTVVQ